ncbi:hypothetical protein NDU88_002399 [Pleurodeles waltl]|uniref:Transglutaminase N-terminal domain-containing protein n=1 Tax=Pleurodeles waltl TaxID=8319 RepID=A0AAV7P9J8_PLEWA|nr:hypothetical protein NDU88_002399 [Pleurodeles waltl]
MSSQLKEFNLHLKTNRAEHHTYHYNNPVLIVRRGQTFKITLAFDGDLHPSESIIFTASTGPTSVKPEDSSHSFTLSNSKSTNAWSAFLQSRYSNSLDVVIATPANTVIGHYGLSVLISSERGSVHHPIGKFILLFNPWCSDDDVYMSDEGERNEYVLNDSGILYLGNTKYIDQQGWNYGQFEENVLDICLDILDHNLNYFKDPAKDCSQRGNPIYIGRVVSTMVNCNDDEGVLMGTWSGDYSDGVDPISWSGSVDILRKWHKGGYKPVRYGQCWVFAGVMCTGIPNRPVTNFISAHDTEGNLCVEEYYDISGTVLKKSGDSVWCLRVKQGQLMLPLALCSVPFGSAVTLLAAEREFKEGSKSPVDF